MKIYRPHLASLRMEMRMSPSEKMMEVMNNA